MFRKLLIAAALLACFPAAGLGQFFLPPINVVVQASAPSNIQTVTGTAAGTNLTVGASGRTYVFKIQNQAFGTKTGTRIQIKFPATATGTINGATVCSGVGTANTYSCASSPTILKWGGAISLSVISGTTYTSDVTPFSSFDGTLPLLIAFDTGLSANANIMPKIAVAYSGFSNSLNTVPGVNLSTTCSGSCFVAYSKNNVQEATILTRTGSYSSSGLTNAFIGASNISILP